VDAALAALGLTRAVVAVVPGFPAAVAIARASDLIALVTRSYVGAEPEDLADGGNPAWRSFSLPMPTPKITVSQMWHPRMESDPAHRWLRETVRAVCRETGDGSVD
jgi:DNA-binding transcriptional LysR family regulator